MKQELKISIEVAENEWCNFLEDNDAESLIPNENLKNSTEKTDREQYIQSRLIFDRAVKAISKGIITIENGIVTQILKYPIKSSDNVILFDKLIFSERWTAKDRDEVYKGMKSDDTASAMAAQRKLCAKLTGIDNIILGRCDISDVRVTDSIVSVFFT
jgi:hypothetical protein